MSQKWQKRISIFILFSFIIPLGYLTYRIFDAPTIAPIDLGVTTRVKSDYALMFIQCLLGVVAMLLPNILKKNFKLEFPPNMYMSFVIFLYCAIFLGEIRNFYYIIPYWDTILHTFSGIMLGALGFSVITLLNKHASVHVHLSPLFVAIFTFCFAITMGVIWEIYEFSFDYLLSLNMQKFALEDGTLLIGRAALQDTMNDLIVDCVGALYISLFGYVSLKYKKGWYERLLIRIKK